MWRIRTDEDSDVRTKKNSMRNYYFRLDILITKPLLSSPQNYYKKTPILFIIIPLVVSFFAPAIRSEITADGILNYVISCISSVATILFSISGIVAD